MSQVFGVTLPESTPAASGVPYKEDWQYSVEGMLAAKGMDWTVTKKPLAIAEGNGDVTGMAADGVFGIFRTDNWKCLGGVGPNYECLQNMDMFKQFQPFLDCKAMQFIGAGSFNDGRIVWAQAQLDEPDADIGGGDIVKPYFLLASSHDMTLATRLGSVFERVICRNTLMAALNSSRSQLLSIRHTRGQKTALETVMETVDIARAEFRASADQYRKLKMLPINRDTLAAYVRQVLEVEVPVEGEEESISTRTANQMDRIITAALSGPGQSPGELTAWSAYNGVTQWITHDRQADADQRRKSLWFGASAVTNKRALQLAMALAS